MIGKVVKASSPSMLGARNPAATLPSPRRPPRIRPGAPGAAATLTGTAMGYPFGLGMRDAGRSGRHHAHSTIRSRASGGLGLAEQVVDRALAVVGEHRLLGERGGHLLPGRRGGVRH